MIIHPDPPCRCHSGANNYRPHWNPECPYYVSPELTESREREALRWEIAKACKEAWDEGNEAGTPLEDPTVRDFLPTADALLQEDDE